MDTDEKNLRFKTKEDWLKWCDEQKAKDPDWKAILLYGRKYLKK